MLQAAITSLYHNILWKPRAVRFIGLDNYIAIAQDPARQAALRETLAARRRASPVFDTERFCRHLEDAFAIMHDRAQRGLKPESFTVPRRPPRQTA